MHYLSNSSYTFSNYSIFAGAWTSTTTLRFFIPALPTYTSATPTLTGKVNLYCNGGINSNIELGTGNTVTVQAQDGGFTVALAFSSAPAYAKQGHAVAVQPAGLSLSFT